ncbi:MULTISPECIES: lysophospholipid acyltransferase family protein [Enterobacteriaceae]|uniref:Lysophospholipid acyltransferase family protein n=1 Tax=Citrobacter bitternis TaxID=1585982 RepID=A0ABW1Q773_9ENTR|nr:MULTISPECIES: lysophospholipid acyltransferase family protein [Phytobacter]MBS6738919.1 1-acyl-sn-glycerol-3-phosphate acyltransferase [Enterobacteriaceae bacterium]PTA95409.1 1-acyl-sn-glycerol-3-phosphate acyltransferase [Kluyvera sp. Nf5]MBY6257655.1 1-acyl-sn-glycerol-3-phosphate acyltransferase [Phytobacter diazotrophicus]MDV2905089.1 lysophospholipid acyltransferase family protein [Phytobacter diazotrophicus]QJF16286.1 1-acyl-sn-glycerol-3-phosphate acyltransferase [Phytobacter diazot
MTRLAAILNRLWRIPMTGFCFALFGLGGVLLSVIWFNLLSLVIRDKQTRRRYARRSISACFRFFLAVVRFVGVLDYRIEGEEILQQESGCLVVANHPSLIDYVMIASVMPETDCLVKSALLKNPFVSGPIRAADYLINSQSETLLSQSQQRLDRGDTILIFPEGTRTRPGEEMTLQRGAANIAVRCAKDLRIVTIHCTEHFLSKQSKWYDAPPSRPLFTIKVGERVRIDRFYEAETQEPALAARQLNRHLLQQLQSVEISIAGLNDASALSRN